jgi:hypothetical protein
MRKSLGTALVVGFATIAATAYAQMSTQNARVTLVDRSNKGFSAQWYTGTANYWTTPRTTYSVGGQPTSFDYIKAGMTAVISSHTEGDRTIADNVVFSQ